MWVASSLWVELYHQALWLLYTHCGFPAYVLAVQCGRVMARTWWKVRKHVGVLINLDAYTCSRLDREERQS